MIPLHDNIPSSRPPVVNYLIIAACILIYLAQGATPGHLEEFMLRPAYLLSPPSDIPYNFVLLTLFTSMFMHGSLLHLASNMLFLWIFGDNVEDRMGHLRYFVFYLLCGLIAALTHGIISFFSPVPVVGASGAISGVLGAYFVLFQGATIRAIVPIFFFLTLVDIPAFVFLGLWFLYQLLLGLGTIGLSQGGVAFWAHIGGFVAGLLLVKRFVLKRRLPPRPRIIDIRYY